MWILITDSNAPVMLQHQNSMQTRILDDFLTKPDEPTLPTNIPDPNFWFLYFNLQFLEGSRGKVRFIFWVLTLELLCTCEE